MEGIVETGAGMSAGGGAERAVLCPYCGEVTHGLESCGACGGRFDPLSRQASQNAMGPWFVRDVSQPFRPGCSYATLRRQVERGMVTRMSVVRGPTTNQFWSLAQRAPGVAHLLGVCHACLAPVDAHEYACARCGAVFPGAGDRQHLGLLPARLLPGQAQPEVVAALSWEGPGSGESGAAIARSSSAGRGVHAAAPAQVLAAAAPVEASAEASGLRGGATRWLAVLGTLSAGLGAMLVLSLVRGWLI
jgi:hypothetical protein